MHDFHFKNGELYCESVKMSTIAKEVGTPCYVYSHHTLVDHFQKMKTAFEPVNPLICFAMKSNDNLAVLKTLIQEGAGFDIVSIGELRKALKAGADPKKIVFASVGKTEDEILLAIRKGILLFNVESLPELDAIHAIALKTDTKVKVALRINPDVEAPTYSQVVTGTLKNKFGIDLLTAAKIMKQTKKYSHIIFSGLHVHIGSQITSGEPFIKAIKRVVQFQKKLIRDGIHLEYLDIGGGLGIIYKDEKPQTAAKFAQNVLTLLQETGLKIIMEPGRFISGNAGIFLTKVLYLKDNGVKKFLIVDGGMNDLMRPTLYGSYHEIVPIKKKAGKRIKVDVVGPICESGDFFAKDRLLPKMRPGDVMALMSAGAYCSVMASNYNMRGHVAIAFVKGNKYELARKAQPFEDLIKYERIPSFLK